MFSLRAPAALANPPDVVLCSRKPGDKAAFRLKKKLPHKILTMKNWSFSEMSC